MMKKVFGLTLSIALALALLTSSSAAATSVTGRKIVIDPGHGGSDFGSTACSNYPEKTANLEIALKLKLLLEQDGALVFLTRTDDSFKSNNDRYTYANTVKGEALVSIHLNGATNPGKNGTLGLYGKRDKDKAFTETLHRRLAGELGVPDLGVTNFASGVLLKSKMPASIQETVFISNTSECQKLIDGTGMRQQQIAKSLYNGLIDWFTGH